MDVSSKPCTLFTVVIGITPRSVFPSQPPWDASQGVHVHTSSPATASLNAQAIEAASGFVNGQIIFVDGGMTAVV